MEAIICPYCKGTVEKPAPDRFMACPECGYRFARVGSASDGCLIIDSKLPDLIGKIQELQKRELNSAILIDRRVGQMPIAGTDRRR